VENSLDNVVASGVAVSEAALLTNRAASAAIRHHLSDSGLVDFDGLPASLQATISAQLGGTAAASEFFASFHFFFRERSFEALDAALQERFRRLGGSTEGWTSLMGKIRRWINRKNEPTVDGTVTLVDVRAAALWHFPPQIPQGFLVPDDYVAPKVWSEEAVEPRLHAGSDSLVVVTGSPGAGKSTYLSWLVEHLHTTNVPVIRHHYFLSITDATPHRTDWETVADSIIGQLLLSCEELVRSVARQANIVPSIGADLLLREFGDEGATLAASLNYRPRHSQYTTAGNSDIETFRDTVRAYLAPIFLKWANGLDRSGIPFSRQWKREVAELARQQSLSSELNGHFDYHYRGGANEPSLAINDRVSILLRSAYLRALHWSIEVAALDVDRAEIHARWVAVMADPTLWAVRPSERPNWWPEDPNDTEGLDTLGEAVGKVVRNRLEDRDPNEAEILAFAAGPVANRSRLRAEVVIRAFLQSAHGPMKPPQGELAKIPWVVCRPAPPRLSVPGNYTIIEPYAGFARDWMVAPLAWEFLSDTQDWILPERQTRGLHLPANWLLPESPIIATEPGQVGFMLDDQRIARYHYWNDELSERHYTGAGSRVGSELLIRRECLEPHLEAGATLCWVVTLSTTQREEYKEQFSEPQVIVAWVIGGSHIVWPKLWLPPSPD